MGNPFILIFVVLEIWFLYWVIKSISRYVKKLFSGKNNNSVNTEKYYFGPKYPSDTTFSTSSVPLHVSKPIPPPEPILPYTRKPFFLSNNERHFLYTIEKIIENKFYIFPQVHYCKIIYAEGSQTFKNPWFNKIDRKSADFVLFDKSTVSPVLVIEIDDSTHRRKDRAERDDFINSVLEKCKIPIIHVHPYVREDELKRKIGEIIRMVD